MTLSILLAVGALLVGAVADLLYRVAQRRSVDTGIFLFWQSVVFSVPLWGFALVTGKVQEITGSTWMYGLPGGLISYFALYLFVLSLRTGDASVNAPVFRLNFVVTAGGAIFLLGEAATAPKIAGIALAALSVAALLNVQALRTSAGSRRSVLTVLAAALLFGVVGILIKLALNEGSQPIPLLLVQTVAFTGSAASYLLVNRRWRPNGATRLFVPAVALLQLVWSVLLFESLALGDASVSYPIVQLSFVLTAVLAVVFLREGASRAKVGGLALAVLAVGMLALA